jgi:hypothetical protein
MAPLLRKNRIPRAVALMAAGKDKHYKSPQRKLVRFFERSRDQWKEKCLEAKAVVKGLKNRSRFLDRSKGHWKSRVHAIEAELRRMKAHEQAMQEELDTLKKILPREQEG